MSDRWRQISQLYHEASARPDSERAAFLDTACGGDEGLRREVESLLGQRGTADGWLLAPAVELAARMMTTDVGASLVGRQIGTYQIVALLGAGGMGEVFRARDPKLRRDVAIKILPRSFALDPDRLQRFEREAHVLASLNHPHIGAIYGFEDAAGIRALVLELVEGPTLGDVLQRGPLPISEALGIARQIADALEAAHESGIVHRDLKPANIKVTPAGVVKVLDFGLAKAIASETAEADLTHSPTRTVGSTRDGMLLGTAPYMSPEQARGKTVDNRTDIWAFGCVLYEMLTGRAAFGRDTVTDTLAAIVEREPDWDALPPTTPASIRRLLQRCLTKAPSRRLHAAADVRIEIEDALAGPDGVVSPSPTATRTQAITFVPWVVAAVAVVAAIIMAVFPLRRAASDPALVRLQVNTPPTSDPFSFALSPDGRQLVFVATGERGSQLWLRPLDQTDARPLTGTEGATLPFWAPDGRAIGFFADGQVKRLDLGSERPQVLAQARNGQGASWNRDGVILFAPFAASPLMRVAATGGTPIAVTHLATGERSHRFPVFLPDGRRFLFFIGLSEPEADGVYLGSLDVSDTRQRLLGASAAAAYMAPGYVLTVRQGVLVAAPFDATGAASSGEPVAVMPVGSELPNGRGPESVFSVSATGLLAHRTGGQFGTLPPRLVWTDRDGRVTGTLSGAGFVQLTPDGDQVAVVQSVQGNFDIWLMDAAGRAPKRFTFDPAIDLFPVWSPNASRLVFSSDRKGVFDLFEKPTTLARDEQVLFASSDNKFPVDWSRDGRFLLYVKQDATTGGDNLWALPVDGTGMPFPVRQTRFTEDQGQFSPDGQWIVYRSNESGRREVYVRPFPGPGSQRQVSTEGGSQPRWRRDGKELFYIAGDNKLMAVPIRLPSNGQSIDLAAPVALFATHLASPTNAQQQYAVAPDGQRFLMFVVADEPSASSITIVQNWMAALKK